MPERGEQPHEMKLVRALISERLKKLRLDKSVTIVELSQETNISVGAISQYENGKRDPDFYALYMLSRYYDVSVDWLLGRTDQRR